MMTDIGTVSAHPETGAGQGLEGRSREGREEAPGGESRHAWEENGDMAIQMSCAECGHMQKWQLCGWSGCWYQSGHGMQDRSLCTQVGFIVFCTLIHQKCASLSCANLKPAWVC